MAATSATLSTSLMSAIPNGKSSIAPCIVFVKVLLRSINI